jgi:hypothetical protein
MPANQHRRLLLTSRKLLQRKIYDIENDLRGSLRNFGLKVGVVGAVTRGSTSGTVQKQWSCGHMYTDRTLHGPTFRTIDSKFAK